MSEVTEEKDESKKILSKKQLILISVCFILFFVLFFISFRILKLKMIFANRKVVSFLIVGTDEEQNRGRTDSLFVIFYNSSTGRIGLISIPRDIRVNIRNLYDLKINAVYSLKGIGGLKNCIENIIGFPLHYYVIIDLQQFSNIIDLIGPIKVFNDKPLKYVDRAGDLYIDLPQGEIELDGAKASQYVRFRADDRNDTGRSERQIEIIYNLARSMLQDKEILKNLKILHYIFNNIKTDLSFSEILWFVKNSNKLDLSKIEMMRIPGVFRDIKGESYIIIDTDSVKSRVRELITKLNTVSPQFNPSLITVQVLNGSGVPGLAARVRTRLIYFGYNVVEFGNADRDDYAHTLILDRNGNSEATKKIYEIIKTGERYTKIDRRLLVDVTVIVGKDLVGAIR